jgi:hypothetical protein
MVEHMAAAPPGLMPHAPLLMLPPLQSEYGDIYKVTLAYEGESVSEVKVKVFDTIPPCVSICVLKTGFLFAASEFGNHALYQFVGTGGWPLGGACHSALYIVHLYQFVGTGGWSVGACHRAG